MITTLRITAILNGWLAKVGCQTLAYVEIPPLLLDLRGWLDDPEAAEKELRETAVNTKLMRGLQAAPLAAPLGQDSAESSDAVPPWRDIKIEFVMNGWLVKVGCQRLVYETAQSLLADLEEFLVDPETTTQRMIKEARNVRWSMPPQPEPLSSPVSAPADLAFANCAGIRSAGLRMDSTPGPGVTVGAGPVPDSVEVRISP